MPIQGQRIGSIKKLKQMTKGGGGGTYLKYIPKNDSLTVRFLTEPEEFVGYYEHYDSSMRTTYPCMGEDTCPGCATDEDRNFVYLAAVVNIADDKVILLTLKKSVVNDLVLRYEKYGTVTDRDYEISRNGEGKETRYMVSPEPPSNKKLSKYDVPDLMDSLEKAFETVHGAVAEEDDDEAPAPKGKAGKAAPPKAKAKAKPEPEPEDEDDESNYTAEDLAELDEDELAAIAEVYDIDPDDYEEWDEVRTAILEAQDEDEEDSDDEDSDDDADDDDEEGEDEEDDEDFWTEEELSEKTIGELRAIAKDYEIPTTGKKPAQIIKAILAESGD
jgi:hypothetical protein